MKISILCSIFNRGDLFKHGLESLARQQLDPHEWELLVLDDMSTQDLGEVYRPHIGKINIRHVKIDHTKHPIFEEMNKNWDGKSQPTWFHTPALSMNIGIRRARGDVLMFWQPEIVLNETALQVGHAGAIEEAFVFADVCLATPEYNAWFMANVQRPHDELWQHAVGEFKGLVFPPNEMYWFVAFLSRAAAIKANGVDEDYLRGVYGEDDNFRLRVGYAGYPSRKVPQIRGIHLNHAHENHWAAQRGSKHWEAAAGRNRSKWHAWNAQGPAAGYLANEGHEWGSERCVETEEEFLI